MRYFSFLSVLRLILAMIVAAVFASCASSFERRIAEYPEAWAKLTEEHKMLASQKRIKEGMDKDAVFFAWGSPSRVSKGSQGGKEQELWRYYGFQPVYSTSIGFGYHGSRRRGRYHHGYCPGQGYYGYEPTLTYVPREEARVEFRNNSVTSWITER